MGSNVGYDAMVTRAPTSTGWTFLTNHAHVLVVLARRPELLLREVAEVVGITERAAQRIVHDLAAGGYLRITRTGRRNRYRIGGRRRLRHPVEADTTVQDLLNLLR